MPKNTRTLNVQSIIPAADIIDISILKEMDLPTLEKLDRHYKGICTDIQRTVAEKKLIQERQNERREFEILKKRAICAVGFRVRDLDEPLDAAICHVASAYNFTPDALTIWVKYAAKSKDIDYQAARKAMILRMARHMKNYEIADYFGIHRNTVSNTIRDALRRSDK